MPGALHAHPTPVMDHTGPSQTVFPLDYCLASSKVGRCRGSFPRWYYDPAEQICKRFIYGGCLGNKNNYLREEECMLACRDVQGGPHVTFPEGAWSLFMSGRWAMGVPTPHPSHVIPAGARPCLLSLTPLFSSPRPPQGKAPSRWAALHSLCPPAPTMTLSPTNLPLPSPCLPSACRDHTRPFQPCNFLSGSIQFTCRESGVVERAGSVADLWHLLCA